jgi:hypothetical protein
LQSYEGQNDVSGSKGWLDQLIAAASEAETPKSFLYWSGLTAIAAVASNNVYLNRRGEDGRIIYQLKPNLYVMLIADSGIGKGLPVALAKECVSLVKSTRVIAGRNSIEGIIKEMSTAHSVNGGSPIADSRAFIVSGEFSNLMVSNPQALTILTEWYDTHFMGEWKNTLKNSPVEKLKGINVTLLGASSPEHFAETVPEVNIRGGFIGRTLMVFEEKRNRTNALVYLDEPEEEDKMQIVTPELVEHLQEISKVKGRFKWTKAAADVFIPWYTEWRNKQFNDKTGTVHRMPDNILKVAMCLSLSRRLTLTLEPDDIDEAMGSCLGLTINTKRITSSVGKHPLAQATRMVLDMLFRAEDFKLSRMRILNKGYGDFDSIDLDRIEQNLVERGAIKVGKLDGKTTYQLTPAMVESYKKIISEN